MALRNTYEDQCRADAYNELELGGTYDLVFRNLPGLLEKHVRGTRALDFGCGTGRSTRFLQRLGYTTTGDEGIDWKSETKIAPWAIYLLKKIRL